ncbi:PREDICTED: transmembrane epididymal protein 1A [Tarenaya hassleriana]|uniref:transmembrane epididymal protein 1A n=1 Tax=Tarenaya hassleriana TaxID=28532 RepID=UPI00053C3007|nr:PREDICTED: transmembrane epididymal protein 1A [Tarenaya hassleriana]
MGTFLGHFVPGLSLAFLGLWHVLNTIRCYCFKASEDFSVRFWFPFPKSKHIELISILFFSLLSIVLLALDFPSFSFTFKPDNLEHASMFLHLAIFVGFALFCEVTLSSDMFSGFIGVLLASVFGQELFLLHFHSTDHVGLEGHYHFLLQLVVFVSFLSALASSFYPKSFSSALVLSVSVLFQGCWFLNMGFMLWVPRFVPKGCVSTPYHRNPNVAHGAVACKSLGAENRAKALANLQFSWILSIITICTCALCLKLSAKAALPKKCQSSEYERLCRQGNECSVAVKAATSSDQR